MNPGAFHPCAVAGWGFTVYWEDGRFLCIFIQSFFVEVWTLQVFVPSGRPSLEADFDAHGAASKGDKSDGVKHGRHSGWLHCCTVFAQYLDHYKP